MAAELMTRQSGITLVELLITMAVATIVGLIIVTMYITSSRTYTDQNRILDAQRSGRITLEAIARVLRETGFDPRRRANAGVEVGKTDELRITRNLNMDDDVEDDGERITFKLFGDVLRKGSGAVESETWQDLADKVSEFTIVYYDKDANEIATPVTADNLPNIHYIRVKLAFQEDKVSGGNFERTYSTGVYCRNLAFRR